MQDTPPVDDSNARTHLDHQLVTVIILSQTFKLPFDKLRVNGFIFQKWLIVLFRRRSLNLRHPLLAQGKYGNAVFKNGFKRAVREGIRTSSLVRHSSG